MPGVEPGSARILLSLRASDDSRYTTSDGNAIIFQIKINILPKTSVTSTILEIELPLLSDRGLVWRDIYIPRYQEQQC